RPGDREAEGPRRRGEVLERQLEEVVRVSLFPADDAQAVRERPGGIAVGDSARDLVGGQEPEPDRELEAEISPAAREIAPACGDDGGGHVRISLTRRSDSTCIGSRRARVPALSRRCRTSRPWADRPCWPNEARNSDPCDGSRSRRSP